MSKKVYLVATDENGRFVGPIRKNGARTGFGGAIEGEEEVEQTLEREVLEESRGKYRFGEIVYPSISNKTLNGVKVEIFEGKVQSTTGKKKGQ